MVEPQSEVTLFAEGASAGEVIRQLFKDLGSNVPIRTVAKKIIDDELLPREELDRCRFRGLCDRVRKELTVPTNNLLPFAQPTGRERGVSWKQLELFNEAEAFALIERRIENAHEDYAELVRLHAWCLEKFGDAPGIPELV